MRKFITLDGRRRMLRSLGIGGFVALLILMTGVTVWARVGGACVNCHTMHNSQDGGSVVGTPLPALINTDCVGCHSSDAETIVDLGDGTRIPIVYTRTAPNLEQGTSTSMLAGGNFHWVANGDDSKGHNVYGISARDAKLSKAPGDAGYANEGLCQPCHATLAVEGSGCEGCHMPAHHADDSAAVVTSAGGSYRFLGDVMTQVFGGYPPEKKNPALYKGVKGIEDPDWEQSVSSTKHNVYAGVVENYGAYPILAKETIGQMCAGCHSNFHHAMNSSQGNFSGVWIRHPSDVLIPNEGEYAGYTTYNPLAPAAKQTLTAGMQNSDKVTPGSDVVTCISCHRPHGSPYPDMLRWDYDTCDAGTANDECGCYVCHTAKD